MPKQTNPAPAGFSLPGKRHELRTVRPDPHHPGVLSRFFWAGVSTRRVLANICLFCLTSCAGQLVWAADYYWAQNSTTLVRFTSIKSACDSVTTYQGQPVDFREIDYRSETQVQCRYNKAGTQILAGGVLFYRYGDGCTSPAIYDATTGACVAPEPDQCATATGEFVHEYNAGSLDASVPPSLPPTSICESGCLYNRTAKVKGCNRFLEATTGKDLDSVYCQVVYQGAGSQCTTDNPPPGSVFDQPPSKPPADSTPQFTSENKCGDWVTNPDGSQSRSCTSNEQLKEPGQLNCDNAGAYLHCTTGKPAPRFEDTAKTEDTTKTTNPDGSTKTETTTKPIKRSAPALSHVPLPLPKRNSFPVPILTVRPAMKARNAKGLAVRRVLKGMAKAKKVRNAWRRLVPAMRASPAVATRLIAKCSGSRRNSYASLRR